MGMEWTLCPRRSSCLRFQLCSVEMGSFLPKCQSNGRDFACQGQTCHLWLHPLGQQTRVEIVERSLPTAGHGRRILEDGLHIMIMILIEPTNLLWFLGTLQLSAHVTVLRTVARIDRETTISPQLPLGAETMRGLDQRDEQRGSDRADPTMVLSETRGLQFCCILHCLAYFFGCAEGGRIPFRRRYIAAAA